MTQAKSHAPYPRLAANGTVIAVGFDLDNTLYEHAEFVEGAYRAVAALIARTAGIDEESFFRRIFTDWERLTSDCSRIFSDALRDYNCYSPDLERTMVLTYRSHRPDSLTLYPGVRESLRRLKESGIRLGLLSDGDSGVQRHKVNALGLAGAFDVEIFTGDLGREFYKPHHKGFELLVGALGAPAAQTVYIGDNPRCDFLAPWELGMRVTRVRTGEYREHPHDPAWDLEVCENLTEAIDQILAWSCCRTGNKHGS